LKPPLLIEKSDLEYYRQLGFKKSKTIAFASNDPKILLGKKQIAETLKNFLKKDFN